MGTLSYSEQAELTAAAAAVLDKHLTTKEGEKLRWLIPDCGHPAYQAAVRYLVHNLSSQYKAGRRGNFIVPGSMYSGLATHLANQAQQRFLESAGAGHTPHRNRKHMRRDGRIIMRRG